MSTNPEIIQTDENEKLAGEEPDPESPPVVTRTRSGRRVRTPASLLVQVSTASRSRTRRSVIPETPCEEVADQQLMEPQVPVLEYHESTTTCMTTDKPDVVDSDTGNEKENQVRAVLESAPEPPNTSEPENTSKPPNKTAKKRSHSESELSEKRSLSIPLGKPKSGRVWKDRNKQRFSALLRDKPLCSSWEKKMEAKREKELVKKYSLQLKEDKARKKEDKRKRHEENLKRRAENERKGEVVQVIRNTTKIKRMKKKQLRKIEKRDTLAMLQKSQPRTPKATGERNKGRQ